ALVDDVTAFDAVAEHALRPPVTADALVADPAGRAAAALLRLGAVAGEGAAVAGAGDDLRVGLAAALAFGDRAAPIGRGALVVGRAGDAISLFVADRTVTARRPDLGEI